MFKITTAKTAIVAAAVCTAGLFSAPAAFARTELVRYADLDLSTPAGQKKLDMRIRSAARRVCDYHQPATGSHLPDPASVACFEQASAKVRNQVALAIENATEDNRLGG